MDLDELNQFFNANKDNSSKIISLLHAASDACKNGVTRSHILNGFQEGALPCEIFSELGSGTMIYSRDYGGIRAILLFRKKFSCLEQVRIYRINFQIILFTKSMAVSVPALQCIFMKILRQKLQALP